MQVSTGCNIWSQWITLYSVFDCKCHMHAVSKPKSWPPVQVSKFTERIDGVRKKNILKSSHIQHGGCVSADHYISGVPGWLPISTGKNNKSTHVVHCLLIMQVRNFSTSVNSLPKCSKHSKANIEWKHLLATKISPPKSMIWKMESLHQEISRRIVMNKSNCKHLAVLVHNTRMALPSKTSRRLHVGQEQVCWVVLFIGLHMSKWSCGIWLLIMLSRYSIDCLS